MRRSTPQRAATSDDVAASETVRRTLAQVGLAETALRSTRATIARVAGGEFAVSLPRIVLEPAVGADVPGVQRDRTRADFVAGPAIGRGGMGVVRVAEQRSLGREVAVKSSASPDGDESRALVREARVMGRLEHPNIVPVHALGIDDQGAPVLVMKRIEGVSWATLLQDDEHESWARLLVGHDDPLRASVEVLAQVCRALEFAHDRGVVHRDVKPDNVMIGRFGEVYLLDWGVALDLARRVDEPRGIVGTPGYIAPELVRGDPMLAGPHTDVYLLGATLYEVLAGRMPHAAEGVVDALAGSLLGRVPPLSDLVPEELAALVRGAMALEPAARIASVTQFRAALARFLVSEEAAALVRQARAALERAEAAVVTAGASSPEAYEPLVEARFGLTAALRTRPDDASARASLDRCLACLVEREVALRSPAGASALLAEMRAAPAALASRVASLADELGREREAAEAHHRARAEANIAQAVRTVGIAAVVLAIASGVGMVLQAWRTVGTVARVPPSTPWIVVRGQLMLFALIAPVLLVARRRVLGTPGSRRLTGFMLVWSFYPALTAGVAYLRGDAVIDPIAGFVIGGLLAIVGAIALLPALWVSVVLHCVSVGVLLARPGLAPLVNPLHLLLNALVIVWAIVRHADRLGRGA